MTLKAINTQVAGAVTKTWPALLVPDIGLPSVLPGQGRIVYPFSSSGGDLDTKGIWKMQVLLSVAGGSWPGDPIQTPAFRVVDFVGRR